MSQQGIYKQYSPDAVTSIAADVPENCNGCLITVDGQNVRFRDDGVDPATGVGMMIKTTDHPFWYDRFLNKIKFIGVAAGAKLNVSFYF